MAIDRDLALVTWLVLLSAGTVSAAAGPIDIDPPILVATRTASGSKLSGSAIAYDQASLTLRDSRGTTTQVPWTDLDPRQVFTLHHQFYGRSPTAPQWMTLGRTLVSMGDKQWSDTAFENARRLDGALADEITRIKASARYKAPPQKPPVRPPSSPPQISDNAEPSPHWPQLTAQESADAVGSLKRFTGHVSEQIEYNGLQPFESNYFLLATDLNAEEAQRCSDLLDRMYSRLCGLFGVSQGSSIWYGKGLVLAFKNSKDFALYEERVERRAVDPSRNVGFCHTEGPWVRIALYRPPSEVDMAHVLVHESGHGFLHRYRSPQRVVLWVNEGLAEWVAYEVGAVQRHRRQTRDTLRQVLRKRGDTGGLFERETLEPWQYDLVYTLTDFMIARDQHGYVAFIDAIKDGKPWRQALAENYGMDLQELMTAYGVELDAGPIRP